MKRAPEAWRDEKLFDLGIGHVLITRFRANGDAEIGVFLRELRQQGAGQ